MNSADFNTEASYQFDDSDGRLAAAFVLLIDPDPLTRRAREDALRRAGFSVGACVTTSTHPESMAERLPDAVLVCEDVPGVDGDAFCRMIKSNPVLGAVPLLRIVADASAADGSGADAWVGAGIGPDELVAYVRVLVRLGRAERSVRSTMSLPSAAVAGGQGTAERAAGGEHAGEAVDGGNRLAAPARGECLRVNQAPDPPDSYRRLVDLAPEAIALNDGERLIYVNQAFLRLVGAEHASEVIGCSPLKFIHPVDHGLAREGWQRVLNDAEQASAVEQRFVRLDGKEVDVEVAAAPYDSEQGRMVVAFIREISRRKQIEIALRQQESDLQLIMDSAPALISYVDAEGRYRRVNQAYLQQFGVLRDEVEGRSVREVLGEAAWALVEPYVKRALAGHRVTYELPIPYAKGGRRWMNVSYTPDLDDTGKVRGFVAQVLDVSHGKMAELRLAESELRFRQIAETISHVFWMTELNPERVLYVSPAFQRIWGRKPDELYANPRLWVEAIHPEDRPAVERQFVEWVSAGENTDYDIEYRIIRTAGDIRWIRDHGMRVGNVDGGAVRVAGVAEDVTERKAMERALRVSEEFKQGVLDSLPAHVAVLDRDGVITAVNEPWRRFGQANGGSDPDHTAVGADYLAVCRRSVASGDPGAREVLEGVTAVLQGRRSRFVFEYPCDAPDQQRWFLMHALKPAADDGGVIVTHLDVTAQKRIEQALRRSQADLEQAQAIGQIGSWRLDLRTNLLVWSDESYQIFGIRKGTRLTYEMFLNLVHPADREHVQRRWSEAFQGSTYDNEHRVIVDGEVKWVRERAELEFEADGSLRGAFGTTQDITERKLAEQQIARLNQDLQRRIDEKEALFGTVPIGLAITHDTSGRQVRGNPAFEKLFGLPADAASTDAGPERPVQVFKGGSELPFDQWPMLRAARGERMAGQLLDVVRAGGKRVTVFSSARPLFDESGRPRGAVGAFLDVTALQRAEAALLVSERRFRAMVQAVPALTFEGDVDGKNTFSSESWHQYTGMTPAETQGRGWECVVHPDERSGVAERWAQAMRSGALFESKHRLRRADGSYRWFVARALPIHNAEGVIERWAGSLSDVDDLVQSEAALRDSESQIRQLLESLPQLVWTLRVDGRFDYLSPQSQRFSGLSADSRNRRQWLKQVHRDDRNKMLRLWKVAAANGEMFEAEVRIRRADGVYHWFQCRAVPLRNEEGLIVKWLGTGSDIERLKQAQAVLRQAGKQKDEFLVMLSHELRNPLAPIRSAAAVLGRHGRLNPELRAAVDIIDRQVGHMSRLLDDLLDLARITRGKVILRKQVLPIAAIIEQSVEASLPLIESGGHELTVKMPPEALFVEGDLVRLVQIMTNLLCNAAKYNDARGKLCVAVKATESKVMLSVADDGMGITADLLPRVFDVFTQGPRALDRSQGGLGIGLKLAKQLVELHGGTIDVRSEGIGRGSEFTVHLPRALVGDDSFSASVEQDDAAPAPRRILVVDDNRDAAEALAMMLRLEGHQVREAYDACRAIEAARSFHPHLILLDIGLPGMDGFELASRLHEDPSTASAVLVAVTGYGEDSMLRRSRAAGFVRHLVKPVELRDVLDTLSLCGAADDR